MSRGNYAWVVGAMLATACRGGDVAATDAAVDRRYTEPSEQTTEEAPHAEPPTAIGGGPTNEEDVYSSSSALNVLTSAWCQRATACGEARENCEGEAALAHGEDLARCTKGIDASILSDCAHQVRASACESTVALAETCTAAVLCVRE